MKSYLLPTLSLILAFIACTPPEEVRLQNYNEPAESGYFAHVPAGLSFCNLALGESQTETENQLNMYLNPDDSEVQGYQLAQFHANNLISGADTSVTCAFKNKRLRAIQSTTTFDEGFSGAQSLLEKLSSIYTKVEHIKSNLTTAKSFDFWQTDDVVSVKYKLLQRQGVYYGLSYTLAYTADADAIQIVLNS